jgi:hypothetical protein
MRGPPAEKWPYHFRSAFYCENKLEEQPVAWLFLAAWSVVVPSLVKELSTLTDFILKQRLCRPNFGGNYETHFINLRHWNCVFRAFAILRVEGSKFPERANGC